MLTCRSSTFACTREQAVFVAECAGLRQTTSSQPEDNSRQLYWQYVELDARPTMPESEDEGEWRHYDNTIARWNERFDAYKASHLVQYDPGVWDRTHYDNWEDARTGGGGARICFCEGIAWVSAHSGYAWADITDEVRALFIELGCQPIENEYQWRNPRIYGYQDYLESKKYATKAEAHAQRNGD